MRFQVTAEQAQLRDAVRAFAERTLTREFVRGLDEKAANESAAPAHRDLLPKMAAAGFTRVGIPIEYGGTGGGAGDVTVLLETFGRGSLSIASLMNRALGWGVEALLRFGTEAQKRSYLSRVCTGEMMFAFSHTETGAGSDARARRPSCVLRRGRATQH